MTNSTEITIVIIFITIIIIIITIYYSCNDFICWLWLLKLSEYSAKNWGLVYPLAPVTFFF